MYQAIAAIGMQVFQMGKQNEQKANQLYQQTIKRGENADNAMESMAQGQLQATQAKGGKILSNLDIAANRRKAEAEERVNAAVYGVEGTTVSQVTAQQDYNAAQAMGQTEAYFNAQFDSAIDAVESHAYTLSSSVTPAFKSNSMKFIFQHALGPRNVGAKGSVAGTAMNKVGGYK